MNIYVAATSFPFHSLHAIGITKFVLYFNVKAEVGSFEGVWVMRLSDCIVRVLIYCNLPDLLHRTSGSAQPPLPAGT